MKNRYCSFLIFSIVFIALGCSHEKKSSKTETPCLAEDTEGCQCELTGETGYRLCNSEGTGWSPCICAGQPTDSGSDTDSASGPVSETDSAVATDSASVSVDTASDTNSGSDVDTGIGSDTGDTGTGLGTDTDVGTDVDSMTGTVDDTGEDTQVGTDGGTDDTAQGTDDTGEDTGSDSDTGDGLYDTPETALRVTYGDDMVGVIEVGVSMRDYYVFEGDEGDEVVLTNQSGDLTTPAERVFVYLRSAADVDEELAMAIFNSGASDRMVYRLPVSGTYYIHVNINSGPGEYHIRLEKGVQDGASLTLTSPDGLESWAAGTIQSITWTSENFGMSENVRLEYSIDGGVKYMQIVPATANSGTYDWHIPLDMPAASYVLVRISDATDGVPYDISDAAFALLPFADDGYEPNDATTSAQEIAFGDTISAIVTDGSGTDFYSFTGEAGWMVAVVNASDDSLAYPTGSVRVMLKDSDGNIVGNLADVAQYNTLFLHDGSEAISYRLTQSGTHYVHVQRTEAGPGEYRFYLTGDPPPEITLAAPAGGEFWERGSTQSISWSNSGVVSAVSLAYSLDGGVTHSVIAAGIPNTAPQSYEWTVPEDFTTSDSVTIRITDADEGMAFVHDLSDSFTVIAAGDDLFEPNESPDSASMITYGDDVSAALIVQSGALDDFYAFTASAGDSVIISNLSDATDDVSVQVFLRDSDAAPLLAPIVFTAGGNEMLTWILPEAGTYYIHVNPAPGPNTDGTYHFQLNRGEDAGETLELVSPEDTTQWRVGDVVNIEWTATGVDSVRIEYSTDGGDTYTQLDVVAANTSPYQWHVPLSFVPTSEMMLRIADVSDLMPNDATADVFDVLEFPADLIEPDDSMIDATPITFSTVGAVEASGAVTDSTREDYYTFYAEAGDGVIITNLSTGVAADNFAANVALMVSNADGFLCNETTFFENGDAQEFRCYITTSGDYFIRVRRTDDGGAWQLCVQSNKRRCGGIVPDAAFSKWR